MHPLGYIAALLTVFIGVASVSLRRANEFPDYTLNTAMDYAGSNVTLQEGQTLMNMGMIYSKGPGYQYIPAAVVGAKEKPVFVGHPPVVAPGTSLETLRGLLDSPGFQGCESDPNGLTCQLSRDQVESEMMSIMKSLDYSTPSSFYAMIEYLRRLALARAQLAGLQQTVDGDAKTAPNRRNGLVRRLSVLTSTISQMESQALGAYDNLFRVFNQRRELMYSEIDRLNAQTINAETNVKAAAKRMGDANARKSAQALSVVVRDFMKIVADAGAQAEEMSDSWDQGLVDLASEYHAFSDPAFAATDALEKTAAGFKEQAKNIQDLMKSTYKATQTLLLFAAQTQQHDFKGTAQRMLDLIFKQRRAGLDKALEKIQREMYLSGGDMDRKLVDGDRQRAPLLKQLSRSSVQLLPWAQAKAQAVLMDAFVQAHDLNTKIDLKSKYLESLLDDVAKLAADSTASAETAAHLDADKRSLLDASYGSAFGVVQTQGAAGVSKIASDLAASISGYAKELSGVSQASTEGAEDVYNSATKSTAEIQATAAANAAAGAAAMGLASDALLAGNRLNTARLFLSKHAAETLAKAGSETLQGAMADNRATVDAIGSAAGSATSAAFSAINNGERINTGTTQARLEDRSAELINDVTKQADAYRGSVSDGQAAVSASAGVGADVKWRLGALEQGVGDSASAWWSELAGMNSTVQSQHKTVVSTQSAALSAFNQSVSNDINGWTAQLASQVNGLQSGYGDSAHAIVQVINEMAVDAGSTTVQKTAATGRKLSHILNELGLAGPNATFGTDAGFAPVLTATRNKVAASFMAALAVAMNNFLSEAKSTENALIPSIQEKRDSVTAAQKSLYGTFSNQLADGSHALDDAGESLSSVQADLRTANSSTSAQFEKYNQHVFAVQGKLATIADHTDSFSNAIISNVSIIQDAVLRNLSAATVDVSHQALASSETTDAHISEASLAVANTTLRVQKYVDQARVEFDAFRTATRASADRVFRQTLGNAAGSVSSLDDLMAIANRAVTSSNANLSKSEQQILKVLLGLSDSLGDDDEKGGNVWSRTQQALDAKQAQVANSLTSSTGKLQAQLGRLRKLANEKALSVNKRLESMISKMGVDLSASEANVTAAHGRFRAALDGHPAAFNANDKQIYSVKGMIRSLSITNRARFAQLLERLGAGELSFGDAMTEARRVDLNSIKTVGDATGLLVGSMDEYRQSLLRSFLGSDERLKHATDMVNSVLDVQGPPLLLDMDTVETHSTDFGDNVNAFTEESETKLTADSDLVAQIQKSIELNRTAIAGMLGDIKNKLESFEGDIKSNQLDYETWINSVIADELGKEKLKEQELKSKLNITEAST